MTAASGMSRAERFEDERRRITESCFAKVDEQGQRRSSLSFLHKNFSDPLQIYDNPLSLYNSLVS